MYYIHIHIYTYMYSYCGGDLGEKQFLVGVHMCACAQKMCLCVCVYACLFLCLFVCVYTQRIPLPFFDDEARGLVDCTTAPHIKHIRSVKFRFFLKPKNAPYHIVSHVEESWNTRQNAILRDCTTATYLSDGASTSTSRDNASCHGVSYMNKSWYTLMGHVAQTSYPYHIWMGYVTYGVAAVSRLDKIIGLFCKIALQKRQYSAKGTYNFIDPTDRSHPIPTSHV